MQPLVSLTDPNPALEEKPNRAFGITDERWDELTQHILSVINEKKKLEPDSFNRAVLIAEACSTCHTPNEIAMAASFLTICLDYLPGINHRSVPKFPKGTPERPEPDMPRDEMMENLGLAFNKSAAMLAADQKVEPSPKGMFVIITDADAKAMTAKLGITDARLKEIEAHSLKYGRFEDFNNGKIGKCEVLVSITADCKNANELAYVSYCTGAELESAPLKKKIVELSAALALSGGGGKNGSGGRIIKPKGRFF